MELSEEEKELSQDEEFFEFPLGLALWLSKVVELGEYVVDVMTIAGRVESLQQELLTSTVRTTADESEA